MDLKWGGFFRPGKTIKVLEFNLGIFEGVVKSPFYVLCQSVNEGERWERENAYL